MVDRQVGVVVVALLMPEGRAEYAKGLARRIRRARKQAKLTQRDVSEALGVNVQRISKAELGTSRTDAWLVLGIARALNVVPGWLLDPDHERLVEGGVLLRSGVAKGSQAQLFGADDKGGRCASCGNVAGADSGEDDTLPRVTVRKQAKVPVYLEVAESLREQIAGGVYRANTPLPSARKLAVLYGTSPVSISNGVKVLIEAGIVYPVATCGVYVEKGGRSKAAAVRFTAAGPVPVEEI